MRERSMGRLFHVFLSQQERRDCGGSAFVELQFCKLPAGTGTDELVAVDSIKPWLDDSLYIDDENEFYREYHRIFACGVYADLKCGEMDLYGINYYAPSLIDPLIETLRKEKPKDYELLTVWLNCAKSYNGFYLLGL
ncbi:MAG: hypothetical protein IK141_07255 [Clostridia bacterium]|nr:hypothetical protein [Clostridia bacterium]